MIASRPVISTVWRLPDRPGPAGRIGDRSDRSLAGRALFIDRGTRDGSRRNPRSTGWLVLPADSGPDAAATRDDRSRTGGSCRPRSNWIWVMPGERRGCIGCHEDRELHTAEPSRSGPSRRHPSRIGSRLESLETEPAEPRPTNRNYGEADGPAFGHRARHRSFRSLPGVSRPSGRDCRSTSVATPVSTCHGEGRAGPACALPTEPAHLRAHASLTRPASRLTLRSYREFPAAPGESLICLGVPQHREPCRRSALGPAGLSIPGTVSSARPVMVPVAFTRRRIVRALSRGRSTVLFTPGKV